MALFSTAYAYTFASLYAAVYVWSTSGCCCCLRLLSRKIAAIRLMIPIAPRATPMPMPAFAPVDRPDDV